MTIQVRTHVFMQYYAHEVENQELQKEKSAFVPP